MNIVCTGDGRFVEVQGTAEGEPFDRAPARPVARPRRPPGAPSSPGSSRRRCYRDRVVLATRNAHKVDELRRILAEAGIVG